MSRIPGNCHGKRCLSAREKRTTCQPSAQVAAHVTVACYNFQHQQATTKKLESSVKYNMSVQQTIESKLQTALVPQYLEVENESHRHSGPATESHFKITAVSTEFVGQLPVKRHQQVYDLLADEMAGGVHALALHLYAPSEWQERQQRAPDSPDCRGGSKSDH